MPWDVSLSYKAAWNDVRYFEDGSLHVTLAPYWVHSFYVDKAMKNVTLKAGVENIFDTSFMEKYGHPGAGIDFVLNLEYRIL
jgi:outer membrane cobalamin receptor